VRRRGCQQVSRGRQGRRSRPAGVGAFCTQHNGVQAWGVKALDALGDKKLPEEVLTELLKNDTNAGGRQLGIIDMKGRSASGIRSTRPKQTSTGAARADASLRLPGEHADGPRGHQRHGQGVRGNQGEPGRSPDGRPRRGDCAGATIAADSPPAFASARRTATATGSTCTWTRATTPSSSCTRNTFESDHAARGDWGKKAYVQPCPNRPRSRSRGS